MGLKEAHGGSRSKKNNPGFLVTHFLPLFKYQDDHTSFAHLTSPMQTRFLPQFSSASKCFIFRVLQR